MKLGRFIIDTHVHAQRHAAGPEFKKAGKKDLKKIKYNDLASIMRHLVTYDNSKRLLYDMECYQVDMCILHPAFGMSNELNVELVEKYPDKFRALVSSKGTADKALAGEIEWTIETACEEIDELLATGKFVGIGEGMPSNPTTAICSGIAMPCSPRASSMQPMAMESLLQTTASGASWPLIQSAKQSLPDW